MFRFAIIDDEIEIANKLTSFIDKYFKINNRQYEVIFFDTASKFLENYHFDFDAILMDINMPGIDGMSATKELRRLDKNVKIIFVTSLAQYAIKGYEVNAFDFIVKPISYYNFSLKLKRALSHLTSLNNYELVVTTKDNKYFININQLVYIEICNHTIIYHLVNEEIKGSGTLKSLYTNLKKHHFAFCNQCYLVNLAFVKGINDGFLLINNEKIRIASSRKKTFMQELAAYIGEI